MNRDSIEGYLSRDWNRVARAKQEHWRDRKRRAGLPETLAVSDELRNHAKAIRPEWPTASEREQDWQSHAAVSEKLRRAAPLRRR